MKISEKLFWKKKDIEIPISNNNNNKFKNNIF